MLCDQSPVKFPTIATTKKGERVVVDPQFTIQRYLMIFYWCINVGALFALATTYAERDIGFWLAYLLPGILYMLMPIILVIAYKRLYVAPPQGSVFLEACKVIKLALADGGWGRSLKGGDNFWDRAKPSYIRERDGSVDSSKVFWDDRFVDEIKQSLQACQVFALIPIFALADGGFGNELNDMSSAMITGSLPNDVISNWNSLAIIVATPILTWGFYPMMAKLGHPLKPMTRMSIGFMLGCITCILCAVIQSRVYATSPCGKFASTCVDADGGALVSSVSLWWQIPIYTIPAVGELFVNVTSYELAYTLAPARMKGLVWALALFNSAIASAIGLAVSNAIVDPYLEWTWTALAVASFLCAIALPTYFRFLNNRTANFMDKDRQAGRQQPSALAEQKAIANGQGAEDMEKY
jgi:POT family proton-dependent oligopeptide transporter